MPAANLITLATDVPVESRVTTLLPGQPAIAFAAAGTPTIHGAEHPGRSSAKYVRLVGDGVKTTWTQAEVAALVTAHNDGGTLTTATILRVVARVNGVIRPRVVSTTAPSGTNFRVRNNSGMEINFGTAPLAGAEIELFILDSTDIRTVQAIAAANIEYQTTVARFMVATAACQIRGLRD
jgi:hypothetical protein